MVEPMSNQMMGYDRAITMFSPDGRLLQVEYAKKMVKQGTTAVGMICKDGVVLVADRRIVDNLIVLRSLEKVVKIDDHIGATVAGSLSDGRVLAERAQLRSQQHKVTYDTPVDTLTIVKDICDLKQICTQSGGLRPFGVSVMIAGIDGTTPRLFVTEPSGIFFEYKATSIGEGEAEADEILHKDYRDDMTMDDALRLGVKIIAKLAGKDLVPERLDAVVIPTKEAQYQKIDANHLDRILKDVKKKK